jgi:hypothetical protein
MFGLDQWVVHFSDGTTLLIVLVVAVLLGLRHASDPDHLTAVTTLVTNGRGGATRLGFTWGLGHASSLLALGVPIVLWKAYLPAPVEQSAEATHEPLVRRAKRRIVHVILGRQRLAMVARNVGDEPELLVAEALDVGVPDNVERVLVVCGLGDGRADVVQ